MLIVAIILYLIALVFFVASIVAYVRHKDGLNRFLVGVVFYMLATALSAVARL